MSWEDAWKEGRSGWDAGGSPPALISLVKGEEVARGARVLVPGCGAGYDLLTLAGDERQVVGIDCAPTAAARFEALRRARGMEAAAIEYLVADFFTFAPEAPFDLIWDYTFLCALEPERRGEWVARTLELLSPTGELWTLIFPVDPEPRNPGGPPHPMSPELVRGLLEAYFEPLHLSPVEASHPGREGKEWLGRWRRR